MENKSLIGQVEQAQIEAWKQKFGEIYAVKCDGHVAYLKKPSRRSISYASVAGKTDPIKFNEMLLNDCFIGGSEKVKTDDGLFLGVSAKLAELIEVKESELEKL